VDTEPLRALWIASAVGGGIAVVITLIAAAGAIPKWSVIALVLLGIVFFYGAAVGLHLVNLWPIGVKSAVVFGLIAIGMTIFGLAAFPKEKIEAPLLPDLKWDFTGIQFSQVTNDDGTFMHPDSTQILLFGQITNSGGMASIIKGRSWELEVKMPRESVYRTARLLGFPKAKILHAGPTPNNATDYSFNDYLPDATARNGIARGDGRPGFVIFALENIKPTDLGEGTILRLSFEDVNTKKYSFDFSVSNGNKLSGPPYVPGMQKP
jgi:hypothetical protein